MADVPLEQQIEAVERIASHEQIGVLMGSPEATLQSLRAAALTLRAVKEQREIVAKQSEDDGLWFSAQRAPEAYLQQELRRLHAAIEGKP
jgi:hypothetical protein